MRPDTAQPPTRVPLRNLAALVVALLLLLPAVPAFGDNDTAPDDAPAVTAQPPTLDEVTPVSAPVETPVGVEEPLAEPAQSEPADQPTEVNAVPDEPGGSAGDDPADQEPVAGAPGGTQGVPLDDDVVEEPSGDDAEPPAEAAADTPQPRSDPAAAPVEKDNERGSVKINDVDADDFPRNEPHVGCTFDVNFFNFDPGTAHVTFSAQPPTGTGVLAEGDVVLGAPDENRWVGGDTYDLAAALAPYDMHPIQGYKVKLDVVTTDPQNEKHKVFWVRCSNEPVPEHGTLEVTKDVVGVAPAGTGFEFLVTGPNGYSEAFSLPLADDVWTWSDAVAPGEYVVTEQTTGGATSTTVAVNGGAAQAGTSATVTVTADATATVTFENVFAAAGGFGELAVSKAVDGDVDSEVTFQFLVTGPQNYSETFSLPTSGGSWEWNATVPVGDYLVEETGTGGADLTTVSVNGSELDDPATSIQVTVAANGTVEVGFVNVFAAIPPGPLPGELVVTKVAAGDDQPAHPEFTFTVSGPNGFTAGFTLPTPDGDWTWREAVAAGTYVVTETDDGDAGVTFVKVGHGAAVVATSVTADVDEQVGTVVKFVNNFGTTVVHDRPPIEPPDDNPPKKPEEPLGRLETPPKVSLPATGLALLTPALFALLALLFGAALVRTHR